MLRHLLLTYGLLLSFIAIKAQTVGIFASSLTVVPSNTVANGTTVSIYGQVINNGSTSVTDYLHLNLAIDTSTTGVPKYYWRSTITYSVTNFAPGTTHTFVVTDVASTANAYKVGGNGTTVIVWPIVGPVTNTTSTTDSARTVIYIPGPASTGIHEFEKIPLLLKNPLDENTILDYDQEMYSRVELVGMDGKVMEQAVKDRMLMVTSCPKGIYFLRFYRRSGTGFVSKKLVIP